MSDPQDLANLLLLEESHFLALNKPTGVLSQAVPGVSSVAVELAAYLKQRDQHPGQPFVGLPHRLDRGTSGVMLIARNQRALKRFNAQFQSRKVGKFYLAVVEDLAGGGPPLGEIVTWSDWIRKIPGQPKAEVVPDGEASRACGARQALLDAVPLVVCGRYCLLLIQLHTGRTHQIRIQAATRGLLVLGDALYRTPEYLKRTSEVLNRKSVQPASAQSDWAVSDPFPPSTERFQEQFALHAVRLDFRHPQTARCCSVTAPPPSPWRELPQPILQAVDDLIVRSQAKSSVSELQDLVPA